LGKALAQQHHLKDTSTPAKSSTSRKSSEEGEGSGEVLLQDTSKVVLGEEYEGVVKDLAGFGAFVEIFPDVVGLVHVSEISDDYVNKPEDVLAIGNSVKVKVLEVGDSGKIKLSMKGINPLVDQKVKASAKKN